MNDKRMYSLNKVAFLMSNNILASKIEYDIESESVYFIFDESDRVKEYILKFQKNEELHNFLKSYSQVVNYVKSIKAEQKNKQGEMS
jgi:hypothetical protein